MPDPLWWQMTQPSAVRPPEVRPAAADLRPCGCRWDVIVFSHNPGQYFGCGGRRPEGGPS